MLQLTVYSRLVCNGGARAYVRESSTMVVLLMGLAVLSFFQASTLVYGETTYYDFILDYGFKSPDFVERSVITVNGEFPGPTIRVPSGNRLEVRVRNDMFTEGVVIHWHGMRQRGTPWADGTAYVTQCPISPGETFTYSFVTEQPGTFFYHGHYGMQRAAGLYGSLIVEPRTKDEEPFTYDEELNLLLSDWYHLGPTEQLVGLMARNFRWVGNPQSLLINGRGRYNCSLLGSNTTTAVSTVYNNHALCNASMVSPAVLHVQHGKTYRLRLTSAATLATLNFALEGHNFTTVEVDGHYVEPVETSSVYLFSGQTYSVLFTANADPTRNYWAILSMRERNSNTPAGLAILDYAPNPPTLLPPTPSPDGPAWDHHVQNLQQHRSHVSLRGTELKVPSTANRRLILLSTAGRGLDGRYKWAINNISYVLPDTPALALYKFNITEELSGSPPPVDVFRENEIYNGPSYTQRYVQAGSRAYIFEFKDVVDVILQNADVIPNVSEVHPWHLHGHDFWVLGYGSGAFHPARDYQGLNYKNPPLRNTVPLFPFGWTVIRFVADNPGVWNFHCHLESHHHMGMATVFASSVGHIPAIPSQALGCGRTKVDITG